MEDQARVINPWVAEILERGGDTDAAVCHAQSLAREAFCLSDSLKTSIDRDFGGSHFRTHQLESLLRKERELDALRQRIFGGGAARSGDRGNLTALLQRRMHEYTSLATEIGKQNISVERRRRLEAYLEARRRQLYLGDADRVRTAISDFLLTCVTNSTTSALAS
jgi:HEPN domain-containing protein